MGDDDDCFLTAKILTHQRNIQRYGRLLATQLTELERQYLHKRIAEEQAELERLAMQKSPPVLPTLTAGSGAVDPLAARGPV
jgi:hypothetical protein